MAARALRRTQCGVTNRDQVLRTRPSETPRVRPEPSASHTVSGKKATSSPTRVPLHDENRIHGKAAPRAGDAKTNRKGPVPSSSLNGHSEYVMQVMRDFFKARDPKAVIEVFRTHDVDKSGTLEFDEFRSAVNVLNPGLTEKDMKALFQLADVDGSGTLEFSEFFNNFRNEGFAQQRREPFFWGKARPRELLAPHERISLRNTVHGQLPSQRTKEDIIDILQTKVDQSNARETFCKFDENHSGRLSVKEFVYAMRDLHVEVSEAQAEDVMAAINARAGSDMKTHVTYTAFADMFNDGGDRTSTTNVERDVFLYRPSRLELGTDDEELCTTLQNSPPKQSDTARFAADPSSVGSSSPPAPNLHAGQRPARNIPTPPSSLSIDVHNLQNSDVDYPTIMVRRTRKL